MAKKTFVSRARVVKGVRWYIDYTRLCVSTGKETRHRQDFDLNDIADLQVRALVADRLVRYIEQFAPVAPEPASVVAAQGSTVAQVVEYGRAVKVSGPRANTHKGYNSISKNFLDWAKDRGYLHTQANDFGKKHARAFIAWLSSRRKYSGVTLNNYVTTLKGIWTEAIGEELCTDNPWKSVKPFKKEEKRRRIFNPDERRIVAEYIRENDYWLFRALLLQFYCYIRPVELIRIKGRSFDFAKGVVKVESFEAKKWKARYATIPASVMPYFVDGIFDQVPANYHPFGLVTRGRGDQGIGPSATALNEHRMYARHKKHLQRLYEANKLSNITGLTWYSWKDTGITMHAQQTAPLSTRDQAGHSDFDMTLVYYQKPEVNTEYQRLPDDLFK